jgi:hypothetical protein
VRNQQAGITETKWRQIVQGYWKIRNCWEGNGHEICRKRSLCSTYVPDRRPKRSPAPPKHKSLFMEMSVSTECHLEYHTVYSGTSVSLPTFRRKVLPPSSRSLRLWRLKRNIASKGQYAPVKVQDLKTNGPLLGLSTLQYEVITFVWNVKKHWPRAAGEMSAVGHVIGLCLVVDGLAKGRPAMQPVNTIPSLCYMHSEIQIGLML